MPPVIVPLLTIVTPDELPPIAYRLALKVPVFVKVALSCRVSPSLYPPPVWLIVPELVIDTVPVDDCIFIGSSAEVIVPEFVIETLSAFRRYIA